MSTALDTSVVVAALLTWHEGHEACATAVVDALESECILPQSTLVEAYAVLTRLPAPHRLRAEDAMAVLEGSFRDRVRVANLRASASWKLLDQATRGGVAGGLVYDARILAEAETAGAERLLTLNRRHFERIAGAQVAVVDPTALD